MSRLVGAGLAARGHDVRHLFFYARTRGASDVTDVDVCAPTRPNGPLSFLRMLLEGRRLIARYRPDVVLTFQHWGNVVGAPLVWTATAAPIIANQVSAPNIVHPAARWVDWLWGTIGLYRLITTNSQETESYYAKFPAAYRARLTRVAYGCEKKTSRLTRPEARAALGLPLDTAVIGCAARLNVAKRLDAAIRMLQYLPSVHLALAGQGPAECDLVRLADDLAVADRVHFLGELQPSAIGDLLAALDVFVFPTSAETFGVAGLEAAVAGVPTVASDLPVLRDVLSAEGRQGALFVDPTDPQRFAAVVGALLASPEQAAELRAAAPALARRHSLDAMIASYADIVERALASGDSR
ncbi:MAG: glycosyltransferase family 4 protein [Ancalomicrobiaceae bacterium]|nr:glycosyltransferase family 4 protein [Ancalomicrobiaceae bacterium]